MIYKVAFLDRDGVINKSNIQDGYIGRIKYFKFVPGSIKAISYLKKLNYKVVVVSNQSGIARGFFKITDVYKIHKYFVILIVMKIICNCYVVIFAIRQNSCNCRAYKSSSA